MGAQINLSRLAISFPSDASPEAELPDHKAVAVDVFRGPSRLFCIAAAPPHTPAHGA